ncbi:MAG: hypothetical protein L7U87_01300 [Chlamydiales bacterium]|nr:hypothetical protein [Chlamydiales bacterium]
MTDAGLPGNTPSTTPDSTSISGGPAQSTDAKIGRLSKGDTQAVSQFTQALDGAGIPTEQKSLIKGQLNTLQNLFANGGEAGKQVMSSLKETLAPMTQSLIAAKGSSSATQVATSISAGITEQLGEAINGLAKAITSTPEGEKFMQALNQSQQGLSTKSEATPTQNQSPSSTPTQQSTQNQQAPAETGQPTNTGQANTKPQTDSATTSKPSFSQNQPEAKPGRSNSTQTTTSTTTTPSKPQTTSQTQTTTQTTTQANATNSSSPNITNSQSPSQTNQTTESPLSPQNKQVAGENKTSTPETSKDTAPAPKESGIKKEGTVSEQSSRSQTAETSTSPSAVTPTNISDTSNPSSQVNTSSPAQSTAQTQGPQQADRVQQVKQIVTQMVSHIQTMVSKDMSSITLTLSAPPELAGANIEIKSHSTSTKQLDISFNNLSPDQHKVLQENIQNNPASQKQLSDALQQHGFTVNKLEVSNPTQANEAQGQEQGQEDREGGQKGSGEQEEQQQGQQQQEQETPEEN